MEFLLALIILVILGFLYVWMIGPYEERFVNWFAECLFRRFSVQSSGQRKEKGEKMRQVSKHSGIVELVTLTFIAIAYAMAINYFTSPTWDTLKFLFVPLIILGICSFWLHKIITVRTEAYFGNLIVILFSLMGGLYCFVLLILEKDWSKLPIALILILYGVFLMRKLPKDIVLG